MKFSDKFIDSLKPEKKIVDIREGGGFGIRVTPGGVKTWFFIFRSDGKRRFLNLGHYPAVSLAEARIRYRDALKVVEAGKDPLVIASQVKDQRQNANSFGDLVHEYIERHAKVKKRGWKEDLRILSRDALRAWGKRKAEDITKRDVVLLLESILERGSPGSANGNFRCIRKVFNFAVERDVLKFSPCTGVKMPGPINRRERALSELEVATLWKTIDEASMSEETKRALKLVLVTAQRPGEVTGMHSDEIEGNWWTIPSQRAKNGKAHRVFLTATALDLIGDLTVVDEETGERKARGYIFPCPHTQKKQPISVSSLAHAVRRNLAWPAESVDGLPSTANRFGIEPFTPHDLRRTAATFLAEMRQMDEVIDAVLNHAKQGIIRVYNLYRYDREKQSAMENWERRLLSIITGTAFGRVIPIGAATWHSRR